MSNQHVVDGLYIGDEHSAMQPDVAVFDVILNVTHEVPFSKCLRADQTIVRYEIMDIDESDQSSMQVIMYASAQVIAQAIKDSKKVLCHCAEGKQRSAAVVANFLTCHKGMNVKQAISYVRDKRRQAWDWGCYVHYMDALLGAQCALSDVK